MTILPKSLKILSSKKASNFLLILLPFLVIITFIFSVNTITPKEIEAPQIKIDQNLEQANVLLAKPLTGIYPQKSGDQYQQLFNYNLFDGLVNFHSGKIEPGIATSWDNLDPTTWLFTIKSGLKFSDGTDLSLADIRYSIEEAIKNRWPIEDPLFQINTVTQKDGKIEIKTHQPIQDFILHLKSIPIISQKHMQSKNTVGTGPYKLIKNDTQNSNGQITKQMIELTANPYYLGKPHLKSLNYHYLSSSQIQSLGTDQLEAKFQIIEANALKPETTGKLLASSFDRTSLPKLTQGVLFINVRARSPQFPQVNPFLNPDVRKAIYMATDYSQLLVESKINAKSSTQPAGTLAYGYNTIIGRLATNRLDARKILKAAGLENNFTFTLMVAPKDVAIAKIVSKQFEEVGLTAVVTMIDDNEIAERLFAGNFGVYLGRWSNDYFSATSTFTQGFKTGGNQNFSGYSNANLDEKISNLNVTYDPSKRERILQESMSLITADSVWIPLWEDIDVLLVNDKINVAPSVPFIIGADISGK